MRDSKRKKSELTPHATDEGAIGFVLPSDDELAAAVASSDEHRDGPRSSHRAP